MVYVDLVKGWDVFFRLLLVLIASVYLNFASISSCGVRLMRHVKVSSEKGEAEASWRTNLLSLSLRHSEESGYTITISNEFRQNAVVVSGNNAPNRRRQIYASISACISI